MTRGWALGDLLATLFERRTGAAGENSGRSLADLAHALLSGRGEVSGMSIATELLGRYAAADAEERLGFFHYLAEDLDVAPDRIEAAAAAYRASRSADDLGRLMAEAEPPRQELLRRLNQAPGGTAGLVAMRVDLMDAARDAPALRRIDLDFRHLFASWFNRGFLVLRRIGWESPASILEKIIAYEAVHEIHSWHDLRLRLHPPDRRCFAFFHPAMPDDPLIFVEVALTRGIPGAIAPILAPERQPLEPGQADTATFYSISNCQAGLRGISFGNSLIKQVVAVLRAEAPHLRNFVTLSPIPGLCRWLAESPQTAALCAEAGADPTPDAETLRALAAAYLLEARGPDGQPRDPVARFHLGNGAEIHDIHPLADLSAKGLAQSRGTMVNYLYEPDKVAQNHEAYASAGVIAASRTVRALVRQPKGRKEKGQDTNA